MSSSAGVEVLPSAGDAFSDQSQSPQLSLGHYSQLVRFKVATELRSEVERTYIGFAWWIIDPIVSMGVYYLVFAVLFQRGGPDFVPFLFTGLLTFRWLNTAICHGAVSIMQENGLMQQVYLPKVIFPIVTILVDTVKFLVAFVLLLGLLVVSGHPPTVAWAALPLLMGVQFLLILGTSCVLAAAMPFLPDLDVVLGHVFRMLFFVSGVFYAIASVPVKYHFYLRLNPIASLIEAYRAVLLEGRIPAWEPVALIASASLVALTAGVALIGRFDRQYPKLT
jgi:lipopolysaccharide transport system permease protein